MIVTETEIEIAADTDLLPGGDIGEEQVMRVLRGDTDLVGGDFVIDTK